MSCSSGRLRASVDASPQPESLPLRGRPAWPRAVSHSLPPLLGAPAAAGHRRRRCGNGDGAARRRAPTQLAGRATRRRSSRHARCAGPARRRWRHRGRGDPARLPGAGRAAGADVGARLRRGRRRCSTASARPRRCGRCTPSAAASAGNEGLRRLLLAIVRDLRVVPILLARQLARMRHAEPLAGRRTARTGAADPRHPRAAGQPPGHLAAEVGAGGPRVPLPGAGDLPADRAPARRKAQRSRALHRAGQAHAARGAGGAGHRGRGRRPPEAHLQHLEEDAAQGRADRRALRPARGARAGRRRGRLLRRARRRARAVGADAERVRRLHRPAQAQRLPLAAHRGDRTGRQDAGSADPHPRDAPPGRTRRGRALEVQGRRQPSADAAFDRKIAWMRRLLEGSSEARARGRHAVGRIRHRAGRGSHLRAHAEGRGDRPARRARRRSTSPTTCTPRSGIAAAAPRSTAASCRSTTSCAAATASRS